MIVAIDGPAGSGKSTVAREIARREGVTYLDTGAMYRTVTWRCLEAGISPSDAAAVEDIARKVHIEFAGTVDDPQVIEGGEDISVQIRTPEVDANVSEVAAYPAVRELMVEQQRRLAADHDVIAEGRDIGTVVFPDAEVKIFLTADDTARAHRRAAQRAGKDAATTPDVQVDAAEEKKVLEDIRARDAYDSTRETSPLVPAEDAVHIDSSNLTVDEVCSRIIAMMEEARA